MVEEVKPENFEADFEKTENMGALTAPISAGDVKKGTHILMGDNRPCKVVDVSTSKTGKHGHAKANIVGIDIFNDKKYQDVCPASKTLESPNIERIEYQVVFIKDDGFVFLTDKNGVTKEDLKLPDETDDDKEVSKRIQELIANEKTPMISVLKSMGMEKIETCKENTTQE